MSAGEIAVLVASIVPWLAVVGLLVALRSLRREIRRLAAVADELRRQTVPLVADAHRVVDQAATEMERVGAVLDTTESVHATVDSASKLAYRAFANPVVKVLAVRAGAATGIRRLTTGSTPEPDERVVARGARNGSTTATDRPATDRHRPAGHRQRNGVTDRAQADLLAGHRRGPRRRLDPVGRAQGPPHLQQAAARLQPDALVVEVGRSARQAAGSAGDRVRDAVSSGRDEMQRTRGGAVGRAGRAAHGAEPGHRCRPSCARPRSPAVPTGHRRSPIRSTPIEPGGASRWPD